MKPIMLLSIIMITAIILAASFGLHIAPIIPLYDLGADTAANALYVCPAANPIWDSVARGLMPAIRYINMFFFAAIMFLFFFWGWGLYQNLLKDKFEKSAFVAPWAVSKAIFWMAIIIAILIATPNSYRNVRIDGADGNWILCDENTPGALPVMARAVKR